MLLAGTGTASAYWTARTSLEGGATAASVGLEQTLLPTTQTTPLATTFSTTKRATAGAVSLRNTGTRAGTYTTTLRSAGASNSQLAGAITVRVGTVASAEACTPTATLGSPKTGTLPPGSSLQLTGQLDPGAKAVLCVQTEMTLGGAIAHAGKQRTLEVASTLTYAQGAGWSVQKQAPGILQSVDSQPFRGLSKMSCTRLPLSARADLRLTHSYDSKAEYRVLLLRDDGRETPIEFPPSFSGLINHDLGVADKNVGSVVQAQGVGTTWVILEKKTAGTWAMVDYGRVDIFRSGSVLGEYQVNCA
jgi:hypothetical protein